MEGQIVSYVPSKKYGFIKDETGNSYFFHIYDLKNKNNINSLIRGAAVKFEPIPTPKGLKAIQVVVEGVYPSDVLISKQFFFDTRPYAKRGEVHLKNSFETREYDDIATGKKHIKEMAISMGYNAIINYKLRRVVKQDGNYKYSVFVIEGDFALITERKPLSESEMHKAKSTLADIKEAVQSAYTTYLEDEELVKNAPKEETDFGAWAIVSFSVFVVIAMLFSR
jgi:cold shock CspA family protein